MPTLIKDGAVAEDQWTLIKTATGPEILQAVPGRNFIVPLQFWREYQEEIAAYSGRFALWLDSSEDVNELTDEVHGFPLIALNFPAFADGRSYSNARELRERFDYKGEIRAIGDVLRDQLYLMSRCGFNAFELRHDQDVDTCLAAFQDFHTGYQGTVAEPLPLFRRR